MSSEILGRLADCYEDSLETTAQTDKVAKSVATRSTFRPRCRVCGCKIRGANHDEGQAHIQQVNKPRKCGRSLV